jgi:hypothetical protein
LQQSTAWENQVLKIVVPKSIKKIFAKTLSYIYSEESGRLLTDVPIVNYFGWGLVAGFINYFVG